MPFPKTFCGPHETPAPSCKKAGKLKKGEKKEALNFMCLL